MEKHYTLEEVFTLIGEDYLTRNLGSGSKKSIEVDGYTVYQRSLRYQTFYNKGVKCVSCGKEGTHFKLDCDSHTDPTKTNRRHFNLYADDGTLMTKDHILPKKWGGKDTLENMQVMCEECNRKKGSIYEHEIEGIVSRSVENPDKIIKYINIEKAILDIVEKRKILSKGLRPGIIVRKTIETSLSIQNAIETGKPYFNCIWTKEKFNVEGKSYDA